MPTLLHKILITALFLTLAPAGILKASAEEERSEMRIRADVQATAGSEVLVHWQGRNRPGDFLTIVSQEATAEDYENQTPITQNPETVRAPLGSGVFEIRYVAKDNTILATRTLRLTATEVDLYVPAEIRLDRLIEITWYGPDEPGDFLALAHKDAEPGDYISREKTSSGNPVLMRSPSKPGSYLLKYISAEKGEVLGTLPVEVKQPVVWLSAPLEVLRGSDVMVDFEGPDDARDVITIVPADAPEGTVGNSERTSRGSPAKVRAPMTLGAHELRYLTGNDKVTLARLPIDLLKEDIYLDVPARADRGSDIAVSWKGPENFGDYIVIVPEGSPEGQEAQSEKNMALVSRGSTLEITAPMSLGTHEVRYVNGETNLVLGRTFLDLQDAPVTLHPPDTVPTNTKFEVEFSGPENPGDYITIKPVEGRYSTYNSRASAKNGSPVSLIAPSQAGEYKIYYMNTQGDVVLKTAPIKVVDPKSEDTESAELKQG